MRECYLCRLCPLHSQATEVWWYRTIKPSVATDGHGIAPQGDDVDGWGGFGLLMTEYTCAVRARASTVKSSTRDAQAEDAEVRAVGDDQRTGKRTAQTELDPSSARRLVEARAQASQHNARNGLSPSGPHTRAAAESHVPVRKTKRRKYKASRTHARRAARGSSAASPSEEKCEDHVSNRLVIYVLYLCSCKPLHAPCAEETR